MSEISIEPLRMAVAALELGLREYDAYPKLLSARDGCIHRFEVAMDLSWKMLQRVLRERFAVDIDSIRSKKDLFREGATCKLIADPEDWLMHYDARNKTSHTYDAEEATRVFAQVPAFLQNVRDLLARLDAALKKDAA